jgi:Xaa-Pro aminopeptidase
MFWYLTGIESPECALVMDVDSGREILFLPPPSRMFETWNGERWDTGDEWITELSGFEEVRPSKDLESVLLELLSPSVQDEVEPAAPEGSGESEVHEASGESEEVEEPLEPEVRVVWTSLQPFVAITSAYDAATSYVVARKKDRWDGRISREQAFKQHLEQRFGVEVKDAARTLNAMRWVKEPVEVEAVRRASSAGAAALVEAMRATKPGVGEWELAALMQFVQVREGAAGPAYTAIVGSGKNSCALHYLHASRIMEDGDALLIDFGPEVDHYVTDITRTFPVGGRFEGRMKELYEAVLAAQEAGIAAVRPGISLRDVNKAAVEVLRERGVAGLLNHGVCHSVGMEVHDPGPRGAKLEPGVVFTIEPGAYDWKLGIGIRIEDVVVCTEDGGEVLSAGVPKTIAEIEVLMAQAGVLELMDTRHP